MRSQVADDYSPATLDAFVDWALQNSPIWQTWAVYRDESVPCPCCAAIKPGFSVSDDRKCEYCDGAGHVVDLSELGGLIITEPVSPCVVQAHIFFKRSFWGSKTTIPACEKVIEQVFAGESAIKIIGVVFAHNHAVRGMLVRLGFAREGLLKSQTLQDGKPVDVVQFGLTKQQWREAHGNLRVQDLGNVQQPEHVLGGAIKPPGPAHYELGLAH